MISPRGKPLTAADHEALAALDQLVEQPRLNSYGASTRTMERRSWGATAQETMRAC